MRRALLRSALGPNGPEASCVEGIRLQDGVELEKLEDLVDVAHHAASFRSPPWLRIRLISPMKIPQPAELM
jgi:hypothetical protein